MIKEIVRQRMIAAMKTKDKKTKDVYAYLLDQMQKAEKKMVSEKNPNPQLTEADEIAVVKSVVKQIQVGIEKTLKNAEENGVDKSELNGYISDREFEVKLYSEFLPAEMSEEQIMAVIVETANSLPKPLNKGMLMKNLMPKVKGKADGKLVATLAENYVKAANGQV